ncbi:uncharacterized protein LOC100908614 [Galendromus occidentalis]|uniref:Uncharacterized protein LOC100908614 n=1 Tax=Galendromus occidentalis TaxID=34638 RepID=A0AAJ7SHB7_9ACAR|nr:uncharacterized protein LOC100908614 [Galendromus occidentalis]
MSKRRFRVLRPVSTILTGGQSPPGQWDDFDLFCQSPYILSTPPGLHQHPLVPPKNLHGHPLDPQIQETSLGGGPLNSASAIPSSYGPRLAGGQAAAFRLQRGGSSEEDKPRLRSNSYYSIPVVEHSGTLTNAYDYHRASAVSTESESCLSNRGIRLEQTKGGRSGKWQEWELQGLGPPPPQGSVPMGGARRPQDIREPLGPVNRSSAYQYKDAQGPMNAKQRGAENLDGAKCQLSANPVDVLTVSARMIHRILPSGIAQLKTGQFANMCGIAVSSINIVDRDTCVVMDMCESAGFMARDLPSPATELLPLPRDWISVQLARHQHTFGWFKQSGKSHTVSQGHVSTKGLLLMNVERNSQFPFMTYMTCHESECARVMREMDDLHLSSGQGAFGGLGGYCVNCSSNTELSMSAQQTRIHHTGAYIEVASIARRRGGGPNFVGGGGGYVDPPLMGFGGVRGEPRMTERRMDGAYSALEDDHLASSTGYIVSFFRVFPGEDSERLDRSWPLWTGARQIHRRLPKCVGLNRISFHKKVDPHSSGITYVLLCECPRIMDYLTEACVLVDQLRARCCGYTALYRVVDSF